MRRTFLHGILVLTAAAGAVMIFRSFSSSEPAYRGKRLSAWLEDFQYGFELAPPEAKEAIRAMGTNAIPILLSELQVKETPVEMKVKDFVNRQNIPGVQIDRSWSRSVKAAHAFGALGEEAAPAVPTLAGLLEGGENTVSVPIALGWIGQKGIDALLPSLNHTNARIRRGVVMGLGYAREKSPADYSAITNSLKDEEWLVRIQAVHDLGQLAWFPDRSVPLLIEALSDTNSLVRGAAAISIGKFGRVARSAATALEQLRDDPDPTNRQAAKWALEQIGPEPENK